MADLLQPPRPNPYNDEEDDEHIEMDDPSMSRSSSRQRLLASKGAHRQGRINGMARHTLGLILLLCVVILWTLSNFLGSVRTYLSSLPIFF